jgi:hypothetical protein
MQRSFKPMQIFLMLIAGLGWFALIAQLYLNLSSKLASVPELIVRYFSYFTILTNLLVAVCCTSLLFAPVSRWAVFFSNPKTLIAITVYIVVVGIVYNTILRFLWKPTGLQQLVDELLHAVIPLLFLFFWIFYSIKAGLKWKDVLPWLIYPAVYCVYALIRGSFSGFYPYPFIDLDKLGLSRALINIAGLTTAFFVLSLIFVAIAKWMSKKQTQL